MLAESSITFPSSSSSSLSPCPSSCLSYPQHNIHTVLRVSGQAGVSPISFLVDSGATISVIKRDVIHDRLAIKERPSTIAAVGANGLPIDIVGEADVPVSLGGGFSVSHTFAVVTESPVQCLLGSDFLTKHAAVIDYANQWLLLGKSRQFKIPLGVSKPHKTANVSILQDVCLQPRTTRIITGQLDRTFPPSQIGLVEPAHCNVKHFLSARSLSAVQNNDEVVIQVMNTRTAPVTLYRGTRLAAFTPQEHICVADVAPLGWEGKPPNTKHPPPLDIAKDNLSQNEVAQLQQLLQSFQHLFLEHTGQLGKASVVRHGIKTTASPIKQPIRRLPVALKKVVNTEVDKMLNDNVIRPSRSAWSSPVVLVKKKDQSWRFCIDFRKLNAVTVKDAYPLPRIDDTLDSLAGAKYFSTLDLASGYWQVELEETDKGKTAFSTPQGHFEFNVMPFGLTNAPATFQRLMECTLAGLTPEQCLVYLDDVIIFSTSFQEHLQRLEATFTRLEKTGLKLKLAKCHFAKAEVRYLGHIVSKEGVKPDRSKIQVVEDYPVPQSTRQLRQFLGLANYYRRFVWHYSDMAEPLHKLTRKSAKFVWSADCQKAFEALKRALTTAPVLAFPKFDRPFALHTDASGGAVGAVLSQEDKGQEHVVAYFSRQLSKAERNYATIEREALAVVTAVKEFYPYLYGHTFRLITDHNPLTTLTKLKDVGGRLARWIMYLQQFNYQFEYKPGSSHTNADALSRIPGGDTAQVNGILEELSAVDIRAKQQEDPELATTVKALMEGGRVPRPYTKQENRLVIRDGVLFRRTQLTARGPTVYQLVLPRSLQHLALRQLHDNSGHFGLKKTQRKVQERVYWPSYLSDVASWVRECSICQRRNPSNCEKAPLIPISTSWPFEKVSWDIMGPLPVTSRGNRYILIVTDLFTKWVEAFPLKETSAGTLANILVDEVVSRYGVPTSIHSDQGKNICGDVTQALCDILGIRRTRTSAYHPQGNGQVERFNRTIEAILAKLVQEDQENWDNNIATALFAYRSAVHEATGFTPFALNFGRTPTLPLDVMLGSPTTQAPKSCRLPAFLSTKRQKMRAMFDMARKNSRTAQSRQKQIYDKTSREKPLQIGDRVWLYVPAVKVGSTKKLASLWRGPYTVIDKTSPVNYVIQLIGGRQQKTVHANRLKLCHGSPEAHDQWDTHVPVPYYDASATTTTTGGGSTDATVDLTGEAPPSSVEPRCLGDNRPQRTRRPPERFGDLIPH